MSEVSCNTEAAKLTRVSDGRWRVISIAKPLADSKTGPVLGEMHQESGGEVVDAVVLAVEAWEAVLEIIVSTRTHDHENPWHCIEKRVQYGYLGLSMATWG